MATEGFFDWWFDSVRERNRRPLTDLQKKVIEFAAAHQESVLHDEIPGLWWVNPNFSEAWQIQVREKFLPNPRRLPHTGLEIPMTKDELDAALKATMELFGGNPAREA